MKTEGGCYFSQADLSPVAVLHDRSSLWLKDSVWNPVTYWTNLSTLCSVEKVKLYGLLPTMGSFVSENHTGPLSVLGFVGFGSEVHLEIADIQYKGQLQAADTWSLDHYCFTDYKVIISVPFTRYFMWEMERKTVSSGHCCVDSNPFASPVKQCCHLTPFAPLHTKICLLSSRFLSRSVNNLMENFAAFQRTNQRCISSVNISLVWCISSGLCVCDLDIPKTPSFLQYILLILGTEMVWAVLYFGGMALGNAFKSRS